jgi:hypothetical protein
MHVRTPDLNSEIHTWMHSYMHVWHTCIHTCLHSHMPLFAWTGTVTSEPGEPELWNQDNRDSETGILFHVQQVRGRPRINLPSHAGQSVRSHALQYRCTTSSVFIRISRNSSKSSSSQTIKKPYETLIPSRLIRWGTYICVHTYTCRYIW